MDDARGVGGGQSGGDAARDRNGVAPQRAISAQTSRGRAAVEVLEGDERPLVGLADVVDGRDVPVFDRRCTACFAQHQSLPAFAGTVGPQELEGDGPVELEVMRAIDDTHSACAEPGGDAVAVGDYIADAIGQRLDRVIGRRRVGHRTEQRVERCVVGEHCIVVDVATGQSRATLRPRPESEAVA